MTDKQIIDVTQCPYYKEDKICTYLPFESKCEGDCNWTSYKEMEEQLKLKEQECEELKERLKEMNEVIRTETTRCSLVNSLKTELNQLKAENDYLKHKIFRYEEIFKHHADMIKNPVTAIEVETFQSGVKALGNSLIAEENNKLQKTLTEIKEIADSVTDNGSLCINCEVNKNCADCLDEKLRDILQKISECEVE